MDQKGNPKQGMLKEEELGKMKDERERWVKMVATSCSSDKKLQHKWMLEGTDNLAGSVTDHAG